MVGPSGWEPEEAQLGDTTCPECGAVYASRTILRRHLLTHAGEKRFACFYCDYRTERKDTLKQHCLKRHEMTVAEFKRRAEEAFRDVKGVFDGFTG